MDFCHCLSPYCFIDQAVTSCMGLKIKGTRFTLAHTETGVGASFTIINKEIKICCASTSSTGTRFFERCCDSPEGFYRINASWCPWTTRVIYCLFSNVPAPWLIFHIFSLTPFYLWTLVHQQLLSGWDAATTTNQQTTIHTLDKYTFDVRNCKWRESFRKKGLSALREWVFSPATGLQESKERLEKLWQYWEKHSPDILNTSSIEGPVPNKKVNRRQPVQTKDFRSAHSS